MTPVLVYRIVCSVNGKVYFGVTRKTLAWRWVAHLKEARAKRFETVLYRAIRKHGADQFTIELVYEAIDAHEAQMVERALIAQYGTLAPLGMNTSTGGENHAGVARTKEAIERMAAAKRGKKWSDEMRAKMIGRRKGIPMSDVQRAAHLAATASPEVRAKHAANARKRWADPVYRATVAPRAIAALRRCWEDPAFRAAHAARLQKLNERKKARAAARPKGHTKSEAMRARWQDPVYRAKQIERLASAAAGPANRERLIQRNIAGRGKKRAPRSLEHRALISARMNANWADPAFRVKVAAGTLRAQEARLAEALLSG